MKLEDKVVLITGGAQGIGRALAERFHAEGARGVAVADVDENGAREVAAAIGGLAIPTDVSREDDVRRAVRETEPSRSPSPTAIRGSGSRSSVRRRSIRPCCAAARGA